MKAVGNIVRGCGKRKQGGVYLECGMSDDPRFGKPLEYFLVDPPKAFEPDIKLGVELVEGQDGHTHIIDWIGSEHYPFATDFLEEVRRFGLSRRVSPHLDYSRLSVGSKIIIVHAKGKLKNPNLNEFMPGDYLPDVTALKTPYDRLNPETCHCGHHERFGTVEHMASFYEDSCIRHLWSFAPATKTQTLGRETLYFRDCPSFSYRVYPPMPSCPEPQYESATIAIFPVTNISVIAAKDNSHLETFEKINKQLSGIPFGIESV
jgi:hypothetical protein